MTNFLSSLILFASYSINTLFANIDCVTIQSGKSGTSDDARVYSICPNTHPTMVSCGAATAVSTETEFDGGGINLGQQYAVPRCIAQNAGGGNGVYAYARCCNFPTTEVSCEYLTNTIPSGTTDDAVASIHCGSNPILTHCSAWTPWTYTDGAYPGPTTQQPDDIPNYDWDTRNYPGHTQCTAQNAFGNNNGVFANVACCSSTKYELQCITRYGAPTPPLSRVECPSDYFMAGCHGWSFWEPNAWFIMNDICYARGKNSDPTKPVYAAATCCRLETDSPTTDPTSDPTPAPTAVPTPAPTSMPTKFPTNSPTNAPTDEPTDDPTIDPTENPTYLPTETPSNSPTENPSPIPTKSPTQEPSTSISSTYTLSTSTTSEAADGKDIDPTIKYVSAEADVNGQVLSGVIGALIFLLLCCCCLGLAAAFYFYRKKEKLENEVQDAKQEEAMSVISSIHPVEGVSNVGTPMGTGTGIGTASTGSLLGTSPLSTSSNKKQGKYQKMSINDESSEEEDEDGFDRLKIMDDHNQAPHRMNSNARSDNIDHEINNPTEHERDTRGLSIDEDEDVLPKEDDGEMIAFKM